MSPGKTAQQSLFTAAEEGAVSPPIDKGCHRPICDFTLLAETAAAESLAEIARDWEARAAGVLVCFKVKVNPSTSYIVIPARLASTRLPRKLLLRETGKTLIQHTYEAASRATRPAGICVAADHQEIFDEVCSFGGRVQMTDPRAASGTDRVAEVARQLRASRSSSTSRATSRDCPASRSTWSSSCWTRPEAVMATLATPIRSRRQLEDPACVKVVFDSVGRRFISAAARSPAPASGTTPCWPPSRRFSISTSACTPIAAIFSSIGRDAAIVAGKGRETRTVRVFCRPAIRSWSAWSTNPPSASTRRRIIGPFVAKQRRT